MENKMDDIRIKATRYVNSINRIDRKFGMPEMTKEVKRKLISEIEKITRKQLASVASSKEERR